MQSRTAGRRSRPTGPTGRSDCDSLAGELLIGPQCIFSNKPSSRNARASQTADRRRMSSTAGTAPAVRDSPTPERSLHTPQAQSAAPEITVSCSSASPSQESYLPIQSFSTTNPYADFARRQWHCRRVQRTAVHYAFAGSPTKFHRLGVGSRPAAPHDQPGREQPVWCDWSQILPAPARIGYLGQNQKRIPGPKSRVFGTFSERPF